MWPFPRQSPEEEPGGGFSTHCENAAMCGNGRVYRSEKAVKPTACLVLQMLMNPVGLPLNTDLSCRDTFGGCDSLVNHSREPESASPNLPVLSDPELCHYRGKFVVPEP